MTRFLDPLLSAWASVVAHKLRSFLTVLGIVIGVAAVIALMAIGRGAQAEIIGSIESLGANLVMVFSEKEPLTVEDAEAIEQQLPNIAAVAPVLSTGAKIVATDADTEAGVTGTTPEFLFVHNLELASGAFFSDYDYARSARVAVLGSTVAEDLFEEADPIGEVIKVNGTITYVIGVLEAKGAAFVDTDETIIVPLSTVQQTSRKGRTAQGEHEVSMIALSLEDGELSEETTASITELLRTRHRTLPNDEDSFGIMSMKEIAAQVSEAMSIMVIFLGSIAAIALLVGGIGVMNIMLVSVLERTREIGIRKALGAQERDIWIQFLIEAALLSFTGGLIGIAVGWGIASGVGYFVDEITPLVTPDIVILAASVSVGIGLFFGFYPAFQASRLNPIDALRAE